MSKHAARRSFPAIPVSTAAVIAAVGLIGAGTYAAWTSTAGTTTGTYTAATVTATEVDHNSTVFTSAISNLVPDDYAYRYRTLSNTGSVTQAFTGAVSGAGTLAGSGGLTIQVDKCTVAWTTVATVSTCTGSTTAVLASAGVSTSPAITYGSLAAGASDFLRYKFTIPTAASYATFGGTTGTVTVAITGAAPAGADRT